MGKDINTLFVNRKVIQVTHLSKWKKCLTISGKMQIKTKVELYFLDVRLEKIHVVKKTFLFIGGGIIKWFILFVSNLAVAIKT